MPPPSKKAPKQEIFPWLFNDLQVDFSMTEGRVGFVYEIENLLSRKRYIGQKKLLSKRTKKSPGKRNKIEYTESDWQTYYGSNEDLKNDVQKYGKANFKRRILMFCDSKAQMNYIELREQMLNDVLLKPDEFYNGYCGGRISRSQLKKFMLKR